MNRPGKIDILCFGDSLTLGYQSPTPEVPEYRETPYGMALQQRLGDRGLVAISGICGELTREMVERFSRDVLSREPRYVVILGGTNDLGAGCAPDQIMAHLRTMYTRAQEAGIIPVAVTVPSIRMAVGGDDGPSSADDSLVRQSIGSHLERRGLLNQQIEQFCRSMAIACVDAFRATMDPQTRLLAKRYSNDGLHLSTAGYELLAHLLWNQVFADIFAPHAPAGEG